MLKIIVAIIVLIIAGILGYASTKPDTFRYERSTVINAKPEKIFAILNDLHSGETWSEWEKVDPAVKRTYSGAKSGKGAIYEWDGNKDLGAGRIEIIETVPPSKLSMTLDFVRPFESHNFLDYTLEPQDGGTNVISAMYGPNTFMGKVMSVFFDCEKMVGEKTDASLANLKALAEK